MGALDTGNWFVRWNNNIRAVTAAAAGDSAVVLAKGLPVINIGPDVVSYTPPPFDVISSTARPTAAPAFADFPLQP